jgi:hypothetical protein
MLAATCALIRRDGGRPTGQRRFRNFQAGHIRDLAKLLRKNRALRAGCAIPIVDLSELARGGFYCDPRPMNLVQNAIWPCSLPLQVWDRTMQKVIEFRGAPTEVVSGSPAVAPPSIEPIWTVVDSLSRTLECIKKMCATAPNGPVRDTLETERANLVIGLFAARVAAMRVSPAEPVQEESVSSNLQVASRR